MHQVNRQQILQHEYQKQNDKGLWKDFDSIRQQDMENIKREQEEEKARLEARR